MTGCDATIRNKPLSAIYWCLIGVILNSALYSIAIA